MRPAREPIRAAHTTYAISSQTWGRRCFFRNERWAKLLIEMLYRYREQGIYRLHAFAIMPDHFHLLITPATTIERALQHIKGAFSREARERFDWEFSVWQRGFADHRIRDAADCDNHIRYIYNNPVKKRLARMPSEYPYCSAFSGFVLDELPQGLKPAWLRSMDGTSEAVPLRRSDLPELK